MTETMTNPLPYPLVPAHVDLRDFQFMALEVARLRDSDLTSVDDAEVFRSNVLSWCVSWHQIPAGSLPSDDATLARQMGFGRDLAEWRRVREAGGLRGWVKCSDGRLYHAVVASKAIEAWGHKERARKKREKDADRLRVWRQKMGGAEHPVGGGDDDDANGTETHFTAATSVNSRNDVAERSDKTISDKTIPNQNTPPPPPSFFTVDDEGPAHDTPRSATQSAKAKAETGQGATIAPRDVVGARKLPASILGHRANALDVDGLKQAVEARDPLAVVAVFHVTPGYDTEWLNATDQMQVGEVAAVLAWRRHRKDPVRMPKGFRDSLDAWRNHSLASRRDMAASLLGALGIAVDVTPGGMAS